MGDKENISNVRRMGKRSKTTIVTTTTTTTI
jgi:hypothetical protein